MRRLLIILFCLFSISRIDGQELLQLIEWGDEAKQRKEYMAAVDYYLQALKKNPGIDAVNYQLAECYRMLRDYRQALPLYKEVFRADEEKFPQARFWYAELLKASGEYEKAAAAYRAFLRKNRGFTELQHQLMVAAHEAETCQKLAGMAATENQHTAVEPFFLNGPFNDFSPVFLSDSSMIISVLIADTLQSNRYRFALLRVPAGASRIDTLMVDEQFSYTITATPGSALPPGSPALPILFAACPINDTPGECRLFSGYLSATGIEQANPLPDPINLSGYNQRQPMLTSLNGSTWLYFTSDRPAGFGGYDLYRSELVAGSFQTPENLGSAVNSPVDELCPFYYPPEQKLYFSSSWYDSFGGFDVFSSAFVNGNWDAPKNMGRELNSSLDELYFQLSFFEEKGWFTSNRPAGKEEYPACCADIYSFRSVAALPDSTIALRILRKKEGEIEEMRLQVLKIPPFDLYFDNDEPDPQSRDSITSSDYLTLYQQYISREELYKQHYAAAFSDNEAALASARIDSFFSEKLMHGMNELIPFLEKLSYLLENECAIEIYLESFASPLNESDYNLLLSKRRILSLLNYFDTVFNGSLEQALKEGRLKIHVKALGDSQADASISADVKDTARSVFSPEAARERRISIVSVKVNRIFTPAKPFQND